MKKILDRNNALLMRQSPKWAQFFAGILLTLGTGIITTAYFVRIDEVVTATGQLDVVGGKETIKSPISGKISKVFVKGGEKINAGDLLVQFDTVMAKEERLRSKKLINLEREGLDKKLAFLETQRNTLKQRLETQQIVATQYQDLTEIGGIAKIQYYQARDNVLGIKNQIIGIDQNIKELEINSEKRIQDLETKIKLIDQQLLYQNVKSSISGTVFDMQVRESSVIQPGEILMKIVPFTDLQAKVYVPNKDIGFVKVGQKAKVRVDAFPSSRYGELNGTVKLIGADALEPDKTANYYRFPIDIQLEANVLQSNNIDIPLRTGMSVTSNLQIRSKRALSVVTDYFSNQLNSIQSLRD